MQLTLRERRRAIVLVAIWLLASAICAVTGPFGTHDALGLVGRLAYWLPVVGLSVLGSLVPMMAHRRPVVQQVLIWAVFVLIFAALLFAINAVVFDIWRGWPLYVDLVVNVGLIAVAIHVVMWLIDFARPAPPVRDVDPQVRFLRRLPLQMRGPLVRIEAQDHYLNVVTTKGAALILLRLGEAVEELQDVDGLLVHRSHWVALSGVTAHRREKGRDLLVMSDGAEVPVSRSNRAAARGAGLV